ncbi:MAG: hypothetical protein BA861_10030 [Desulfobacterales bacterium S3730MH5]|nr:MAG: hypothetical protein BA861_10030 [Desulfobacterales bacterium S3730MH5]
MIALYFLHVQLVTPIKFDSNVDAPGTGHHISLAPSHKFSIPNWQNEMRSTAVRSTAEEKVFISASFGPLG